MQGSLAIMATRMDHGISASKFCYHMSHSLNPRACNTPLYNLLYKPFKEFRLWLILGFTVQDLRFRVQGKLRLAYPTCSHLRGTCSAIQSGNPENGPVAQDDGAFERLVQVVP